MADATTTDSQQPEDNPTPEEKTAEDTPSALSKFNEVLLAQGEMVGSLELLVQQHTAQAELSQVRLEYERNILRLMARYAAGLLDKDQQLEMWHLVTSRKRSHGLGTDMKGIYLLGDDDASSQNPNTTSDTPHSSSLQDEVIKPTDDPT